MITSVSRMANLGGGGGKALNTKTSQVVAANGFCQRCGGAGKHHGNHAVVLFPGAAAAEEGDEEDHNPHGDDDDGDSGGRRVLDLVGVVQTNLNQDAHDNQGQAAQLQGGGPKKSAVWFAAYMHSSEPPEENLMERC